jgi:hypothetical protein
MHHNQKLDACHRNTTNWRDLWSVLRHQTLLDVHCPGLLLQAHITGHDKRGFIDPDADKFE